MKYFGFAFGFALLFAALGFASSQFYPFMSGPLAMNICEPFSPCRLNAMPGYIASFALAGVVLGLVIALVRNQKKLAAQQTR